MSPHHRAPGSEACMHAAVCQVRTSSIWPALPPPRRSQSLASREGCDLRRVEGHCVAGNQLLQGQTHLAEIGAHGKHLNQLQDTWFRVSGGEPCGRIILGDDPMRWTRRRLVHFTMCRTVRIRNGRTFRDYNHEMCKSLVLSCTQTQGPHSTLDISRLHWYYDKT